MKWGYRVHTHGIAWTRGCCTQVKHAKNMSSACCVGLVQPDPLFPGMTVLQKLLGMGKPLHLWDGELGKMVWALRNRFWAEIFSMGAFGLGPDQGLTLVFVRGFLLFSVLRKSTFSMMFPAFSLFINLETALCQIFECESFTMVF